LVYIQACIDEPSTYGVLSRDDILSDWLEHTTAQLVIDDLYCTQSMDQADSMLEVYVFMLPVSNKYRCVFQSNSRSFSKKL